MRAFPALILLLACLATGALVPAGASDLQPLPDEPAPHTPIPAPPDPAFSSSETRLPGGRVTEIEVRTGGSRYYLQPQTPAGGARPESERTVRWNILNFDPPRAGTPSDQAPELAPVPPPPRAD